MLDSVAESVLCTPRAAEKSEAALLFKIYQTICVGTRRYGFLTSQDENEYSSL